MSTLSFHTLIPTTLDATLLDCEAGVDANQRPTLHITLEVSWAAYDQIAANEWFNFHLFLRPADADDYLEEAQAVQLELALRAPLYEWLLATTDSASAEALPALFASAPDSEYGFLLHTESWNLHAVKQSLELPEEMEGEVAAGFSTRWFPHPSSESLIGEVAFLLQKSGWNFEQVKENLFRAQIVQEVGEWRCLVQIDPENAFISVYSVIPDFVPEAYRATMLIAINTVNYDLAIGNFEMDTDDGELRFRTSVDVEGTADISALFQQLLLANLALMGEHLPMFRTMAEGKE